MADEIILEPYSPVWPILFEQEAEWLRNVLPERLIVGLEHFGSTAIPGMEAKPVIDILLAVRSLDEARRHIKLIEGLDYAFWADNPKTDRLFFVKGLPPAPRRTHHLHVTETSGELWQRLLFRDYLRVYPDDAARYSALKRDLAARFTDDREAYTAGKDGFVEEIMEKARAWEKRLAFDEDE
jgi:GrpB-like predicted nucleotidyltransferase (UPF0157 family)